MGNAYIEAILIKVTNIHLVFTLTQSWNMDKYFFDRFVLLPNSDEWYQMKQSLSIMIPMTKSCIYKGIYTFYQNLGLVWSLVTHDAFHLSLVARQIYWKKIVNFSWLGLCRWNSYNIHTKLKQRVLATDSLKGRIVWPLNCPSEQSASAK